MIEFITAYSLGPLDWALVILCAFVIGFAKTSIQGGGAIAAPILAAIFGGRVSAAINLPLLTFGDMFGIRFFHEHTDWKIVLRLLPWSLAGIALASWVGAAFNDGVFLLLLALSVLISVGVMAWREFFVPDFQPPKGWWFAAMMGLVGGFTTMIGNASAPLMAIYLLSMRLEKKAYIGTSAWYFVILNLVKYLPHIFLWHTMTLGSFLFDCALLPAVTVGAYLGKLAVKHLPIKGFRLAIIGMAALASVRLFFR